MELRVEFAAGSEREKKRTAIHVYRARYVLFNLIYKNNYIYIYKYRYIQIIIYYLCTYCVCTQRYTHVACNLF